MLLIGLLNLRHQEQVLKIDFNEHQSKSSKSWKLLFKRIRNIELTTYRLLTHARLVNLEELPDNLNELGLFLSMLFVFFCVCLSSAPITVWLN